MSAQTVVKYSARTTRICRHGFYYIVDLAEWLRRRRGKALRNVLFVVRERKFGMQGRLLNFQMHPSECVTNYPGAAACRSKLDLQDLRRVVKREAWLNEDEIFPHVGDRPEWGYMNTFELGDSEDYVPRGPVPKEPMAWEVELPVKDWREILLECLEEPSDMPPLDGKGDSCAGELEVEA